MRFGDPLTVRMLLKKRARGERTPLDERPEVDDRFADLWIAFRDLSRTRAVIGNVAQPVTQHDLLAWAMMRGWASSWEDMDELREVVASVDQTYLNYRASNGDS